MSFPRYAVYKDSGVEWLGEVPQGWEVKRLKRAFRLLTEKTDRREFPVALENIESWSGRFIPTETEFEGEGVAFNSGDILFGKLRPYLAKALLVNKSGEAVGDFHVLRPSQTVNGKFGIYQILNREFISIIDGSTFGAKMPRASWDFMANIILAFPNIEEQTTIAAFLDCETAKIDNLINEQKKLIELLKEKRQAVISTAVTKGLNPDAPMKDGGVEWLGEVPQGWTLRKLISVTAKIGDGLHGTPKYVDESEYYFINGNNLVDRKIVMTDKTRCVSYDEFLTQNYAFNSSTLFLSINGTIGNIAFYNNENLMLGKSAAFIDCKPLLRRDFLAYFFDSNQCQIYFNLSVTGTTISNLGLDVIRSLKIPLPSIQEQTTIVAFLDQETAKIDNLIQQAQKATTLLQERRTALISAAVTGKIDVRGFATNMSEVA